MPEQISVDGDERLRATMRKAGQEIENLDQEESARLVLQRAQARAPKVSGTLSRSLVAKDMGKGRAVVQSELVYAPVIHYGWAGHNIRPQPFLTTALEDSVTLVEANDLRLVNQALAKVKGA